MTNEDPTATSGELTPPPAAWRALAARLWPDAEQCCGDPVMPREIFHACYGEEPAGAAAHRQLEAHRARHAATELVVLHVLSEQRRLRTDLMGLREIAEAMNVTPQRINELNRGDDAFPLPVAQLRMGPVFDRRDIEEFCASKPRRETGRPRQW